MQLETLLYIDLYVGPGGRGAIAIVGKLKYRQVSNIRRTLVGN